MASGNQALQFDKGLVRGSIVEFSMRVQEVTEERMAEFSLDMCSPPRFPAGMAGTAVLSWNLT